MISLVGTYSHLDFGNDKEFSFRGLSVDKNFEPTGVDGEWELNGKFTVEDGSGTSSNINKIWEGEWNSSYGKITLTQNNNNITGDYTNVAGILLGEMTASEQLIEGNFTNPARGKNGSFEFWYRSSTEFIGKWKWDSDSNWRDRWNGWK